MDTFVSLPLEKLLNRSNIITRLERVEAQTGARPSARAGSLSEISSATGSLVVVGSVVVANGETGEHMVTMDDGGLYIEMDTVFDENESYKFGVDGTPTGGVYGYNNGTVNFVKLSSTNPTGAAAGLYATSTTTDSANTQIYIQAENAIGQTFIDIRPPYDTFPLGRVEISSDLDLPSGRMYMVNGTDLPYTLLTSKPAAETNTNAIFRCDSPGGTSAFVGTIATLPGGATLTYNVTSGTEGAMVPQSTSQLAKMRLYNTTRGTNALISDCVTGTNTITLTATVPAGWVVGDTITIASQTVTGAPISYVDLEITSGITNRSYVFATLNIISTTVGDNARIHPLETFGGNKQQTAVALVASQNGMMFMLIKITSNVFSLGWTGTPTNVILTEFGYLE